MEKISLKKLGIYIHVPFCLRKCPYCAFYSRKLTEDILRIYVKTLIKTIKEWGKILGDKYKVDTVYFGGGTPNLLGEKNIYDILTEIEKCFELVDTEITLEVNPFSANDLNFEKLKEYGINRVSVGMQSANNLELESIGRLHSHEKTIKTIEKIKNASINNISLDVMLNIPKQTQKNLEKTLNFCKESSVDHVSAYILKIEKNTPFYENREKLNLISEEEQCNNYLYAVNKLQAFGFKQYEISNFSKKEKQSKHNLKYWNLEDYLGLGPSAHSLINGKRFFYENSLENFLSAQTVIVEDSNVINMQEEYTMLRLRLKEGLVNKLYLEKFKKNIPEKYFLKAKNFEKIGLLKITENKNISLTSKGFLVSNKIISDILF